MSGEWILSPGGGSGLESFRQGRGAPLCIAGLDSVPPLVLAVGVGVGDMAKISHHNVFRNITILSRFFVMMVLLFCLSSTAKIISLL